MKTVKRINFIILCIAMGYFSAMATDFSISKTLNYQEVKQLIIGKTLVLNNTDNVHLSYFNPNGTGYAKILLINGKVISPIALKWSILKDGRIYAQVKLKKIVKGKITYIWRNSYLSAYKVHEGYVFTQNYYQKRYITKEEKTKLKYNYYKAFLPKSNIFQGNQVDKLFPMAMKKLYNK